MKKNHIITLAIVLGSFVIGGTTLGIILNKQQPLVLPPSDDETIQTSGGYSLPSTAFDSTKLELINLLEHFDVSFNLLPEDSEHILVATWEGMYYNRSLPDDYHFELEITGEELDNFLVLSIDFDNETTLTWVTKPNIVILINPMYSEYKFSSAGEEGNLDVVFDTKRELVFSKMEASTTEGDIYIQLNHTILNCGVDVESVQGEIKLFLDLLPITGNIDCTSVSGDVYTDFWDILFVENQSLTAITEEGTTSLRWAQHTQLSHSVNITAEAYYNCKLRIWCPIEFVRYDSASIASEGPCDFSGWPGDDWVVIEPDHYVSTNFNDTSLDFFQVSLKSSNFSTYIHLVDCFKPRRYCGHMPFMDTIGYDVLEAGDYTISAENFPGTDIVLTDYTAYANTTLNISILESNSTNIIETSWDLIYHTGGDSGFGSLEIDFSYEIIDTILHIYLDLEYDPILIRPIYIEGEINIKIHPDYDFLLISAG